VKLHQKYLLVWLKVKVPLFFMRQLAGEGQFEGADLSILDGIRAE